MAKNLDRKVTGQQLIQIQRQQRNYVLCHTMVLSVDADDARQKDVIILN